VKVEVKEEPVELQSEAQVSSRKGPVVTTRRRAAQKIKTECDEMPLKKAKEEEF